MLRRMLSVRFALLFAALAAIAVVAAGAPWGPV